MAVTFDAQSTADTHFTTSPGSHTALTVGAGANRALVALIVFDAPVTITAVQWDATGTPQAMTLISGASASSAADQLALYGLINPTSGAKTLRVTYTGTAGGYIAGVAYTGVNQSSIAAAFPHGTSASGTGTTNSVTVTSAVGNAAVAAHVCALGNYTAVNQTQVFLDNTSEPGASNRAAGAATVNFTATIDSSQAWLSVATDIAVPSAGGAVFNQAIQIFN